MKSSVFIRSMCAFIQYSCKCSCVSLQIHVVLRVTFRISPDLWKILSGINVVSFLHRESDFTPSTINYEYNVKPSHRIKY